MSSTPPCRFGIVVPVKPPAIAKSRLAELGDRARQDLVVAFAVDTVAAALECVLVDVVLVVTDDHVFAEGLRQLGAQVIPDGTVDDLNGSLVQAAAELNRRRPELSVAALCADLPTLRPEELARALSAADPGRPSFVPDAQGDGTTMLAAPRLEDFAPAFGPGSRRRHLEGGAVELDLPDIASVRRDVDTPADLVAARALGFGARTSLVATGLTL